MLRQCNDHAPIRHAACCTLATAIALLMLPTAADAASLARSASGSTPAAIQAAIDLFREDLGGFNNGVGNSFANGRREINWDGVPDAFAAPNALPNDFFNVNSPRGVVFSSTAIQGVVSNQQPFMVSADSSSATPVRFGNPGVDPEIDRLALLVGVGVVRAEKRHVDPALRGDNPSIVLPLPRAVEPGDPFLDDALVVLERRITKVLPDARDELLDLLLRRSHALLELL